MPAYPYDGSFNPAAPMVPVQVARPYSPAIETVRAMVDSGSDITTVPATLAESLGLQPAGETPIREVLSGERTVQDMFSASFALEDGQFSTVPVILWNGDYVLLGRDVLKDWKVTLDGPQGSLGIE